MTSAVCGDYLLPCVALLIAKTKGDQRHYYRVDNARVDGKPHTVLQIYLGSAKKGATLVQDPAAPSLPETTSRQVGLPGAWW